jgi:hypothetical protein
MTWYLCGDCGKWYNYPIENAVMVTHDKPELLEEE